MTKAELARRIFETSNLKGKFRLRSGVVADEYFDKYRFEANPALLKAIAQTMAQLIPPDIDALAGLEMGGIPIATMLSQQTGLPVLFVRKKAKDYGTCKLAEGGEVAGKRLLIVEDVVTSGGQIVISTEELRALGAQVDRAVCVIDRESGGPEKLLEAGIKLTALFRASELRESLLNRA